MTADPYTAAGEPIKVGLLIDMPDAVWSVQELVYGFVREQYARAGRLDRRVEFVVRRAVGAPSGYIKNVVDAYRDLVAQGCLLVVGPNHADNNIAVAPHTDECGVPLLALGATAAHLGEFVFSMAWSSIPDDAALCASWLAGQGCRTVTVTYDRAAHGAEYVEHFTRLAPRAGLRVLAMERLPVICDERLDAAAADTVIAHRGLAPDGIVHFGTGPAAIPWATAVNASGWNPRRVMNDAFCLAAFPATRAAFEGWVGTTLWDDDNTVLTDFVDDLRESHPDAAIPPMEPMAHARDAMATALEGIVLSDILTPAGVKDGLERVRAFPAAAGGPRTSISFGPYDHRGHKGADVMVLRRVIDGDLVMEGRYDPPLHVITGRATHS